MAMATADAASAGVGGAGGGSWAGKRNARRVGGMADALSLAADLGLCPPPPSGQVENSSSIAGHNVAAEQSNGSNGSLAAAASCEGANTDPLIRVLRELTTFQRSLVNLQVELQGRQEDHRVAHLTHVSEIEKKSRALEKTTSALKDVIQNKDRIIARLQQPYSLDCIPVETEYQRQFSELLVKAAGDYGVLCDSMTDLQWSNNFKYPPAVWGELLRPIPAALASCTRYSEALSAMRDAVIELRKVRAADLTIPAWNSELVTGGSTDLLDCVTPPQGLRETVILEEPCSDDIVVRNRKHMTHPQQSLSEGEDWGTPESSIADIGVDMTRGRRISWPPSPVNSTAGGIGTGVGN